MGYIGAVYQGEESGAFFRGKVGSGEGYLMVLCGISDGACIDMELSSYVVQRLRRWVQEVWRSEDWQEKVEEELDCISAELKYYEELRKNQGRSCIIQCQYLVILLYRRSLGLLTVRGTGQAWVCNRSMGRMVKEKLLPQGHEESIFWEIRGQVGILISAGALPEGVCWQQALTPEEISDCRKLQRILRELVVHRGEKGSAIGYLMTTEEGDEVGDGRY